MRGLIKVGLALGLAVVVAGPAMAQRGGGGGVMLLMNKSVQEELKLDKDQIDKLGDCTKKFREDHKDDFAKLGDRNTPREDREALVKKLGEEGMKMAADILKPEQVKRFKQIQFQMEGPNAFAGTETQTALKLTDKQKDDLKEIVEDLHKQQREIFQNAGDDREGARKKMMALRKEKMEAVMKVLTDEQKKTCKELSGEPFEVKFERP